MKMPAISIALQLPLLPLHLPRGEVVARTQRQGEAGYFNSRNVYLSHELTYSAERHPDNVAASLFGGFVGTYLNELKPEDVARKEIPLSEVLPSPAGGIDTGMRPPEPPLGIGHYRKFDWAPEIKAIAIIPDFVVPTADARNVLPQQYSRADVVCLLPLPPLFPFLFLFVLIYLTPPGIQPPTRSPPPHSSRNIPARPRNDLPRNAR